MDVANRRSPAPAAAPGFTVIELIVTLAITLVLTTVAVPAWRDMVSGNTISSARSQFARLIALARKTAIMKGQYLTLCPSSDQQQCSGDYLAWQQGAILFIDHDADRQRDSNEPLVRVMQPLPRVTIQSSRGRRSIRYAPDGSAWGSNLTLRFCTGNQTAHNRAIVLYGTGRLRYARQLTNGDPISCR